MPDAEQALIPAKKCASCGVLVTPETQYCPVCSSSLFVASKIALQETDQPRTTP